MKSEEREKNFARSPSRGKSESRFHLARSDSRTTLSRERGDAKMSVIVRKAESTGLRRGVSQKLDELDDHSISLVSAVDDGSVSTSYDSSRCGGTQLECSL